MSLGSLYGIGVGPGAPDLITVRAVRILGETRVVLAAASPRNDYSTALEIARPYLRRDAAVLRLDFPMTRDRIILEDAWARASDSVEAVLRRGEDAVFLTLGDPLVYSTFGYLTRTLRKRDAGIPIEIVPGITSFQAAAALTGTVLCEGDQSLRILPGIADGARLEEELDAPGNAVILKAYRNFPAIRAALERTGRLDKAVLVSLVGLEGETVCRNLADLPDVPPPYLSLVLSKK